MASANVPGTHGWGNPYYPSLPGALGLSLRHGEGLRALFLFGRGTARSENQAKFVLTKAYLHHSRAPPRTSNSANLVHGNHYGPLPKPDKAMQCSYRT
jgi:hypothetical protein